MQKTGLTFYLPQPLLEQIKIEAVREKLSLSDLVSRSALAFIGEGEFDPAEPAPRGNSTKVSIYLYAGTKTAIKKAAAAQAATVSHFLYQALSYYLANKHRLVLPRLEEPPGRSRRKPQKRKNKSARKPFVYRLTAENEAWIRMHAAETAETRKDIIFDAIKKAGTARINNLEAGAAQSVRTSMKLNEKEEAFLRERARELDLSVSELINRALYFIRR